MKERAEFFPSCGVKDIAHTNNIDYLGALPFSLELAKRADLGESVLETDAIGDFQSLVDAVLNKFSA